MINKFINLILDILLHVFFCGKKVKLAKYGVKLAYFKLLKELTRKYENKNDRIEFLNRYKKQNKLFNKRIIKSFLYYGIFPTLVLYALYNLITLNIFIIVIIVILMVQACVCDIIVCCKLNQLDSLRNAMAELVENPASNNL